MATRVALRDWKNKHWAVLGVLNELNVDGRGQHLGDGVTPILMVSVPDRRDCLFILLLNGTHLHDLTKLLWAGVCE